MTATINYQYRTLVTLKTGCGTSKEWLNSVFPINVGDYIELPSFNIKARKRTTAICKVLKVWKAEPFIKQM